MKHCQIIEISIKQLNSGTLPILLIKDKISLLTLIYIRELQQIGRSQSTILKHITSIGLFWDYYLESNYDNKIINSESLLKNFIETRINGTIDLNGVDNTNLNWRPVKLATAKIDLSNLTEYSQYLEGNYNALSLNPLERKYQEDLDFLINQGISKKHSFFHHINQKKTSIQIKYFDRNDNTGKQITGSYKAYPHKKIEELIKVSNLRDKLIFILLAYGGVRSSEIFHIFLNDISFNHKNQTANIILANPVEGKITWVQRGKSKTGLRQEFLSNKYSLLPRNKLSKKDSSYAGWKNMTEDDSQTHSSIVYWSNPTMGKLFYTLHQEYMKIRISNQINHPYYFISLTKQNFGKEFTMNSLKSTFYFNSKKIGLISKNDGVSLHGLRHFYGYYCANVINLSKEITQRMLHHRSISSTEIYYNKSASVIEEEIKKGYKIMELNNA